MQTRLAITSAMGEIAADWKSSCTTFANRFADDTTTLLNCNLAQLEAFDARAVNDNVYVAKVSELSVVAEIDISVVDGTGWLEEKISERVAWLASEDGALMFLIIETANQEDIGKADGNFSGDDMIAATDPAVVRALLLQAGEEHGHEWDPEHLDAMVAEIVATAWTMRASPDEEWEDIDDDIEWYERGVFKFAREELFAPVAALAVGGICYGAAAGSAPATGGVSLGAAAYCGGLAAATYNAADTWSNGGAAGDVLDAFTDPRTWGEGAATGLVFQGATNFLLRGSPRITVAGQSTLPRAYHYTFEEYTESIARTGLRPGAFGTPRGSLNPLTAHVELALPPNSGFRNAVIEIDLVGLRAAGYPTPRITQVTNVVRNNQTGQVFTVPGGGFEMKFDYAIPPEYIKVVIPS